MKSTLFIQFLTARSVKKLFISFFSFFYLHRRTRGVVGNIKIILHVVRSSQRACLTRKDNILLLVKTSYWNVIWRRKSKKVVNWWNFHSNSNGCKKENGNAIKSETFGLGCFTWSRDYQDRVKWLGEILDKSNFLEGVNEQLLKVSSPQRNAPFQIAQNLRRRSLGFTSLHL